jgi:hypothetical protein
MAFSFNLGGDDIDMDENDSQASTKDQEKSLLTQASSTRPVKSYFIGEIYPKDDSTRSFVSTKTASQESNSLDCLLDTLFSPLELV